MRMSSTINSALEPREKTDIQKLSNTELLENIRGFRQNERKLLRKILEYICEIETRKLFAEIGYPSVFDWLVKDLGYSESSAYRRMMAARALRQAPKTAHEIAEKIEDGTLNLVSLAKVQSALRNEERRTGQPTSIESRSKIFKKIENKTTRETEQIIAKELPESASVPRTNREMIALNSEVLCDLERVRQLKSHSNFGASIEETIAILAKDYLDKNDPLRCEIKSRPAKSSELSKPTFTPQRKPLAPSIRNFIRRRAGDTCEYQSADGHRCGSSFQVEIDHIEPVALGGTNAVTNLRLLCRVHNSFMAAKILGRKPHGEETWRRKKIFKS